MRFNFFGLFDDDDADSYRDPFYGDQRQPRPKKAKLFQKTWFKVLAIFAVFLFLFSMFTVKIHPGFAGIVYNQAGGVANYAMPQGRHVILPFYQSVVEYPVSTEVAYYNAEKKDGRDHDDSLVIGTKDSKTIRVDAQLFYHMSDLPFVFTQFRGQSDDAIAYGFMKQNTQRILNDITSQYTLADIAGDKKPEVNAKFYKAVADFFLEYGVTIEEAGLGRVEPDEQTKQVIQGIANAQYAAKQAGYEKEAAIAQAQTQIEQARGNAEAMKMAADAQAYANQKVQQSVTPELIQYQYAMGFREHWNGQLPTTTLGGDVRSLVQLK